MSTKRITRVAMGVALFVVLSLMLQVPVYQNYYVSLGYFVMAMYMWSFGAVDGTIVGAAGVVLYCIITGGTRGMPGWTIGNVFIGIFLGTVFGITKSMWNDPQKRVNKVFITGVNVAAIVFSTIFGILLMKSFTEVVLYAQPMTVRMATNLAATIADIITLILALPVAMTVDKILTTQLPGLASAK